MAKSCVREHSLYYSNHDGKLDRYSSLSGSSSRFEDVSDAELLRLVSASSSKNTEYSNVFAEKLFVTYLRSRDIQQEIHELTKEEFSTILPKFYASVRAKNGEHYSGTTMLTLRSSLNRCIAATRMPTFCIITDEMFSSANRVFKAVLKKIRETGKGKINHKSAINHSDLQKLYRDQNVFDINTAIGLINKVFFEVTLYFCRRGVENLSQLRKTDFEIREDEDRRQYVIKVVSEVDKNHSGINLERNETEGARMYAVPDTNNCPVRSFKKLTSKLNQSCPRLFQMPRTNYCVEDDCWFQNKPIGKNILSKKLSQISKEAGLSRIYTNHCLRATSITTLSQAGFEARHIRTISGHKNDASLDSYVRETSTNMKRAMSEALSSVSGGSAEKRPCLTSQHLESCSQQRISGNNDVLEASFDITPMFEGDRNVTTSSVNIVNNTTSNAVLNRSFPSMSITANTVVIHNHYNK